LSVSSVDDWVTLRVTALMEIQEAELATTRTMAAGDISVLSRYYWLIDRLVSGASDC